jgi:hypothetical protein
MPELQLQLGTSSGVPKCIGSECNAFPPWSLVEEDQPNHAGGQAYCFPLREGLEGPDNLSLLDSGW